MNPPPLGQVLVRRKVITSQQLEAALQEQAAVGGRLGAVLARMGLASEEAVYAALSEQMGVPYIRVRRIEVSEDLRRLVPAQIAHHYRCLPMEQADGVLKVAVADPLDVRLLDDLKTLLRCEVRPALADEGEIAEAIQRCYGVGADTIGGLAAEAQAEVRESRVEDVKDLSGEASVSRLVGQILAEAFRARATDVHLEPGEKALRLRYRLDGLLYDRRVPAEIRRFHEAIVSRIKVLARLNIAEKRLPQDGRFTMRAEEGELDVRVSVLPTPHGEAVNLRLLSVRSALRGLEGLGLLEEDRAALERVIQRPHGVLFATGPTGSGKTTTLYACLKRIHDGTKKILTIEDPIEYQLEGVIQMQVQPKIGLTFAQGLRAMLRHDPDVMMVGEVRDPETAEATVRAALTGHFVLSSLHTNDAPSAVPRLLNMGVEPYLISSTLEAVVAQRLVRVICPDCRREAPAPEGLGRGWNLGATVFEGAGCEGCGYTGYRGRTALYEVLMVDDAIRGLIEARAPAGEIREEATRRGMRSLAQDGAEKVRRGWTTVAEALRATQME
ncbi:MAG: hypothetical protein A3F84_06390 [Candidatus Handelsmanbacteria bacterium RIFCSPLOWO2_12_FULL_64_10]|uniref:Bacterial type II secretion system protein E domain-containing protein n=1 Tax=Handelsmanbacteria sp. (strain RIFCSPLOWO2_12_FULL_64_10) TaxID=1817868 RepID=A0A1F6CR36_HANXR|nr:MAG: hypothetical protein A3F84_06390 [Candidatus Handelsmanbacteria bacterium RIFCSPLOWO2_12_FULL_64_10]